MTVPGFFTPHSQRCVGIDISAQSIKIVELRRSRGVFTLEGYGIEPLPALCSEDLTGADPKSVARVLANALKTANVHAQEAVVAIPDALTISKTLEVDADLAGDDLELYVRLEAEQHVPYGLEDMALDFEVQGCSSSHPERVDVLLVVCRQATLGWYRSVLSRAGLRERVITVQTHGLARAVGVMAAVQASQAVAVVEFGLRTTVLNMVCREQVIYSRELLFGFDGLDDEAFKVAALSHLGRGLELFAASGVGGVVGSILLCGTTSLPVQLSGWIEGQCGLPTQLANPFASMTLNPALAPDTLCCDASMLVTACGLAMRGFD